MLVGRAVFSAPGHECYDDAEKLNASPRRAEDSAPYRRRYPEISSGNHSKPDYLTSRSVSG